MRGAAAPLHVDLRDHTASRVSLDAVSRADAIFVMDVPQLVAIRQRFPAAQGKTFLLTSLADDPRLDRAMIERTTAYLDEFYAIIDRPENLKRKVSSRCI